MIDLFLKVLSFLVIICFFSLQDAAAIDQTQSQQLLIQQALINSQLQNQQVQQQLIQQQQRLLLLQSSIQTQLNNPNLTAEQRQQLQLQLTQIQQQLLILQQQQAQQQQQQQGQQGGQIAQQILGQLLGSLLGGGGGLGGGSGGGLGGGGSGGGGGVCGPGGCNNPAQQFVNKLREVKSTPDKVVSDKGEKRKVKEGEEDKDEDPADAEKPENEYKKTSYEGVPGANTYNDGFGPKATQLYTKNGSTFVNVNNTFTKVSWCQQCGINGAGTWVNAR